MIELRRTSAKIVPKATYMFYYSLKNALVRETK